MPASELTDIWLEAIDLGERLRPVDPAGVEKIAASIAEIGLQVPILVRCHPGDPDRYRLIAGAHRYWACRSLGHEEIAAIVVAAGDDEAVLAEIDENLLRHDLSPLDRAAFVGRRREIFETTHGRVRRGGDRKSESVEFEGGNQRLKFSLWSFSEETKARTGLGDAALKRALSIAKIAPDLRARLAGTVMALKEGELYALSRQAPERQAQAVELLCAEEDPAPTVADAVAIIDGRVEPKPTREEFFYSRLVDAWVRAPQGAKTRFIDFLVGGRHVERPPAPPPPAGNALVTDARVVEEGVE